jgi:hypothetical protein
MDSSLPFTSQDITPTPMLSQGFGKMEQKGRLYDPFGLFKPLGISYCILFYIIGVFSFIGFIGYLILLLYDIFINFKKSNKIMIFMHVYMCVLFFILYIQDRIFYNMCLNSS